MAIISLFLQNGPSNDFIRQDLGVYKFPCVCQTRRKFSFIKILVLECKSRKRFFCDIGGCNTILLNQKAYWNLEGPWREGEREVKEKGRGMGKGTEREREVWIYLPHSAVWWGSFQNCAVLVWRPWISVKKRYKGFFVCLFCFVAVKMDTLDLVKPNAPCSWIPLTLRLSS